MDERDYDIAMVEVTAANDALEQEWRDSLAGRRAKGKDGSNGGYGNGNPSADNLAAQNAGQVNLDQGASPGQSPPAAV